MEQQLDGADKKLVEQLYTIQKLNRDKDRRDQEIFNLEEEAQVVIDMVQPPHPGYVDTRSVLERLKHVPKWLKEAPKKKSSRR